MKKPVTVSNSNFTRSLPGVTLPISEAVGRERYHTVRRAKVMAELTCGQHNARAKSMEIIVTGSHVVRMAFRVSKILDRFI